MSEFRHSIKDDFKAMHRELNKKVALLKEAVPDKLVLFPNEYLLDVIDKADEFRVYMFNPDFEPIMILPALTHAGWDKIASMIFEYSLPTAERGGTPGFLIWLFTDYHLIGCFEIDSDAANSILLFAAPWNSCDHNQDKEILADVTLEALAELDSEYEVAEKVLYP